VWEHFKFYARVVPTRLCRVYLEKEGGLGIVFAVAVLSSSLMLVWLVCTTKIGKVWEPTLYFHGTHYNIKLEEALDPV